MSVITLALIILVVYLSWDEIIEAWRQLETVNLWILSLLIPAQLLSYYATGEMVFEYLRGKGLISEASRFSLARVALEANFVNHVLPSGGVSGISYMSWRLTKFGVSPGSATMAQVVRYAVSFIAFVVLVSVAVLMITLDGNINRWIILVATTISSGMIVLLVGGVYLVSSRLRIHKFGRWMAKRVNGFVRRISFGRKKGILKRRAVENFFFDFHDDYVILRRDKKILTKPLIWAVINIVADVSIFLIAFWALGFSVNPAPILIAYGVASVAGFIVITPGGAGAYEAIMVAFLAVAGVTQNIAIAGILLARIALLIGTILLGYVFYQLTVLKYGKAPTETVRQ